MIWYIVGLISGLFAEYQFFTYNGIVNLPSISFSNYSGLFGLIKMFTIKYAVIFGVLGIIFGGVGIVYHSHHPEKDLFNKTKVIFGLFYIILFVLLLF